MTFALFQCICIFCSLPWLIQAQNSNNITLGWTLTAGDASKSSWVSSSGDFAFGFQQVAAGGFLAAVWYDKIPEKTITWSANRDKLAQQGSQLKLTAAGLQLIDPNGKNIWTTTGVGGVVYAAMLDVGNLVLANESHNTLWQSFDRPTDTILPTQIVNNRTTLLARFSKTNYSRGRFRLQMQNGGSLVLSTINWPQDLVTYTPYFNTSTTGNGHHMVFNESGLVYVADKNQTVVEQVLQDQMDPTKYLYQRAILEFDGVFRRYVYPRSTSTNQPVNWTMQDFVPQDICSKMTGDSGGGACGFNSYCEIGDDKRPKCGCLPGYSFFDEIDQLKGCKPDFIAQNCLEEAQANDQFELREMFPGDFIGTITAGYEAILASSEIDCRNSCLFDCLCAGAVLGPLGCWKKKFPLSNGYVGPGVKTKAFVKVRIDNSTLSLEPNQPNRNIQCDKEMKHRATVIVVSVFLGSSVLLNFLLLHFAVFRSTLDRFKRVKKLVVHQEIAGTNVRSFSYSQLHEATNGFKEVIGRGAYAIVYKGLLDSEEGKDIAVKKLNDLVKENEREFESEVKAIAITGHRNLVQLIGYCNEEQHRLLVYEYMPNGSIADILFRGQRPSWFRRVKFAFEIARGLNYLHEECNIQIIHCDIKPQNVLLDGSFAVRISDFGLAKLLRKDQTHTLTGIRGTKGYVAPEWFRSVPITTKVDVFSFGILMLEIICCRRCFIQEMEDESQMVLADWAYDCYKEGRVDKLVEDDEEALNNIEKVKELVMVALWCIQEDPSHRPSMNKVVEIIKGTHNESPSRDMTPYIFSMNDLKM